MCVASRCPTHVLSTPGYGSRLAPLVVAGPEGFVGHRVLHRCAPLPCTPGRARRGLGEHLPARWERRGERRGGGGSSLGRSLVLAFRGLVVEAQGALVTSSLTAPLAAPPPSSRARALCARAWRSSPACHGWRRGDVQGRSARGYVSGARMAVGCRAALPTRAVSRA